MPPANSLENISKKLDPSLLHVLMDNLNELFSGQNPRRIASGLRVDHVLANVILDDLGDKAVQSAATRGRLLQHHRTFIVCINRALHRFYLTTHSLQAIQK